MQQQGSLSAGQTLRCGRLFSRLIGPGKGTTQGYRGMAFGCHRFGGADATMLGQGDR